MECACINYHIICEAPRFEISVRKSRSLVFANNVQRYSSFLSLHLFYYFLISRTDSRFTADGFFKPFGTNCWRRVVLGRPQWRTVGLITSSANAKKERKTKKSKTFPPSPSFSGRSCHPFPHFCLHQQQLRGPILNHAAPLKPTYSSYSVSLDQSTQIQLLSSRV